jgi:hypothetical protein
VSLVTYADLKTSVAAWLARDDLTAQLDDMVTLFEACANRKLRVRQMQATTTLVPTNGAVSLPADFLSYVRVTDIATARNTDLDYLNPSEFQREWPTIPSGQPRSFTIEASTLTIAPTSSTNLQFVYYQKVPALSGTANWLYASHPDLYLWGTLTEGEAFNRNPDFPNGPVIWKGRRDEVFGEIDMLDRKNRSPSNMRVAGNSPTP